MIIDAHINITDSGKWGVNELDVSATKILKDMDEAGIDKAGLLAMSGIASNKTLEKFLKGHPDRFFGFGNIEDYNNPVKSIKELKSIGAIGVKIHPRFENVVPLSLIDKGVYEIIEKNGLILKICGWLQSSSVPIEELTPFKIDRIAKAYPNLKIILSHLGGHHYWDAFFVARANRNVYLDTSYFSEFFMGTSLLEDFVSSAHQIDQKLIYGSDFPEGSLRGAMEIQKENFKGNSGIDIEDLFSRNFLSLL